jgi:hypothetical protein
LHAIVVQGYSGALPRWHDLPFFEIALAPVRLDHIARMSAYRGDGKHFIVRADEKLSAFVELEAAIRDWST